MEGVKNSLGQYRLEFNKYPDQLQDLIKPSAEVQKSGQLFTPLAEEKDLSDVWGFPYLYKTESEGRSYTLTSLGADGIQGGEGPKQDVHVRP